MSPFNDLGQRCGGPRPLGSSRSMPPVASAPTAGPAGGEDGLSVAHLVGFARVMLIAALGLAGLLSAAVGGVVVFQNHVLRTELHAVPAEPPAFGNELENRPDLDTGSLPKEKKGGASPPEDRQRGRHLDERTAAPGRASREGEDRRRGRK